MARAFPYRVETRQPGGVRVTQIYHAPDALIEAQQLPDGSWSVYRQGSTQGVAAAYVADLFILRPVLHAHENCTNLPNPFPVSDDLLSTMLSDRARWCLRCAPVR